MERKLCNDFVFHTPETVQEALELLDRYGETAKLMSGGTDLIPKLKALVITPDHVISLKRIKELDRISYDEADGLRIGAMYHLCDADKNEIIRTVYPSLQEGIHSMANTQVRNAGTITGNICNAVPSADTAPALISLDAQIEIRSLNAVRVVPAAEFFTGVCRTVVAPNEMVTEIRIPTPRPGAYIHYDKSTVRRGLDLALVGVASYLVTENGVCTEARIALGAVAAVPKRAPKAEAVLVGRPLTEALANEAAVLAAMEDCLPITDIRATKEYRQELVRLSVRDAILACMKKEDNVR